MINSNFKIFQTYYDSSHKEKLSPEFEHLDVSANPIPEMREFPIIRDLYKEGRHKEQEYTGLVSFKMEEKMASLSHGGNGLFNAYPEIKEFLSFNKGYDVYIFNPFRYDLSLKNVWRQGEGVHTGICDKVDFLFRELSTEYPNDSIFKRDNSVKYDEYDLHTYSMCNYWVGNEKFWNKYINFVGKVYDFMNGDSISSELKDSITSKTLHHGEGEVWYVPFIIERLTSSLIYWDEDIKSLGWKNNWKEGY